MAMLFVTTLIAALLPEATATPTPPTITSITPDTGHVGGVVQVVGEIDTQNGSYTIFFDEKEVKNGTAVDLVVNDTFVVPHRPMGNYTVKLYDVAANASDTAMFTVETAYYIQAVVPSPPKQLQEGNITKIWVNVTGGEANTVYFANISVKEPPPANLTYWTTVSLTNTTTTGYGEGSRTYPTNFSAGAHTNYTGIYNIAFNETLASGNFTVGLTNATEYHRFQFVSIRAANYTQPNEYAWVNITRWVNVTYGEIVFSENISAVDGMIEAIWEISGNASMGIYTVNITSSITNGTIKLVPDTQNFTIAKIPYQIQTKKLNGEVLADIKVDVYTYINATEWMVASNKTDEEGLTIVLVEGGNYTLEAFWAIKPAVYVPVGILVNQSIKEEPREPLVLWCWIAYLNISISPPLPFINIAITYHGITDSFETDRTGIWEIPRNMPTNISYTIKAQRHGLLFFNKTMEKIPAAMNVSWVNITITVPTYTMFVHVLDSKGLPIQNVEVAAYEWGSGVAKPVQSGTTNAWGSVALLSIFGKYKIWVYNQDRTIVLNETVVNLIEDRFLVIHCKIFNVDLSVMVKDYFGNPISNALVKVERENVDIPPQKTGSNGKTSFENITGGEVRISVSVEGKLCETRTIYLDETRVAVFKLYRYVMVAGYPLETIQFIACISLGMLVAFFALALIYRRLRTRKVSEGKEKSL
ncbi:MAG: hypothetical protein ACE5J6_03375 [Candidatus Bathyarchaeia archaeon]